MAATVLGTAQPWGGAVQGQVALRRDLLLDGNFGFVSALAADRAGRIYVGDAQVQEVHVFDGGGERLPTLGRRGSGPGEFQGLTSLVVGRGDTLFTFDAVLQRITAFAPGEPRRAVYTIRVSTIERERASYRLLVPAQGSFLLPFAVPHGVRGDGQRLVTLRTVGRDGTAGEPPLARGPDAEALVTTRGNRRTVGPLPYGREPAFALGPGDRVYHGWSGSPDISVLDLRGGRAPAIHTEAENVPVEASDVRLLLESYPAGSPRREEMRQAVRDGRLPDTKPAWRQMLVDDRGRLWVNVVTAEDVILFSEAIGLAYASRPRLAEGGVGLISWWVYDAAGKRVGSYMLPNNVSLWQVSDGKAYGIEVDADGVQRLVRYTVAR